jgi:hypothetical protein
MKTQINTLVNGSSHVIGQEQVAGTNNKIRSEIGNMVKAENPEVMAIKVKGIELLGRAQWSVSRKSVTWNFGLSIEEYIALSGGKFGVSPREGKNKPYLTISGTCEVCIGCGNSSYYIPESWVEILY